MKINSERIRLVELRYFDKDHNGVELSSPLSYAILYEIEEENVPIFNGTRYINMFGLNDFDLVLKRSKFYSCLCLCCFVCVLFQDKKREEFSRS